MLQKYFKLSSYRTSTSQEVKAGITTFLTLSYILFIQPAILSGKFLGIESGMDFGALLTGTCIASAIGTLIMAFYARLPIAQAPGMTVGFFFMTTLLPAAAMLGGGYSWQTAIGAVFFAALVFLILSLLGVTSRMLKAFSPSMRLGLVVGIGLFITLIGLQNSSLISKSESTGLTLRHDIVSPDTLVFFVGLFLGALLHAKKVKSYILFAMIGAFVTAAICKLIAPDSLSFQLPEAIVSLPPSPAPLFMKIDFLGALSWGFLPLILILLILSIFDATGTIIAITKEAGRESVSDFKKALIVNPISSLIGACFGMSTTTSFLESLSGVEQGGRTGLTGVTIAVLFLLSLFFYPLIAMIANYPPITAPALVLVGVIMLRNIKDMQWGDYTEMLPAFLLIVCIPFFFSIADGIGVGLIAHPLLKLLSGKVKDLNPYNVILGLFFLAYFIFLR